MSYAPFRRCAGEIRDAASRAPVGITRHGKTRFILASVDHYNRLAGRADTRRAYRTEDLSKDLAAALLAGNADLAGDEG